MLGDRERSRPVAEVARSFLQVDRDRIVDQRPNIALARYFINRSRFEVCMTKQW